MTSEQSFNCVFCQETFNDKEQLQVHFRKHSDPSFNTKNRFEKPAPMSSEPTKESGLVNCDVCSQTFPTISKAITHKHKVHPDHDAKYFCPWCGKLFTMKHLYNVHVETNHSNQENLGECFHCDYCEVDFLLPSAMIYHNKFFHRQEADLPDVGSSKKICLLNQEAIQIFYCAFCGEEYKNKVNLFKHMTDDHSDENQSPEEVLRCPLCEAVFYHLDAYEIHLTFHSTEDMYSVENPLINELTDFSLETVQPLMEKVENCDSAQQNDEENPDPESTINSVGIERFLELAMDQSDDSNNIKVKKHKKHKKSKKAAITLDEFLSMNTDVFGEDLDIQGVEEVPTRVVKKHLKKRETKPEKLNSAEIAKLKKQGIVIKKKASVVKGFPMKTVQNLKVAQHKIINEKQGTDVTTNSPNAMLSKLLNQSNNQIRIIKKSSKDNTLLESVQNKDTVRKKTESNSDHESDIESTPKSNTNNGSDGLQPINKADDAITPTLPGSPAPKTSNTSENDCSTNKNNEPSHDNEDVQNNLGVGLSPDRSECKDKTLFEHEDKTEITPKHLDLEDDDNCLTVREHETSNEDSHDGSRSPENCKDSKNIIEASNTSQDSLTHLKHLSHFITVKPVSKNKNPTVQNKEKSVKMNDNSKLSGPSIESNEIEDSLQTVSNKGPALDAIKNLSKIITIKPVPKVTKTENQNNSSIDEKSNESKVISKELGINKNLTVKKIKVENPEDPSNDNNFKLNKSPVNVNKIYSVSQKINTNQSETKTLNKNEPSTQNVKNAIPDVLKRLPNIQTKPKVFVKPEISSPKTPMNEKSVNNEEKPEVIEIFDVDDSEDEIEANLSNKKFSNNTARPPVVHPKPKPIDALKNLSKHLTIKSVKNEPTLQKVKAEENSENEDECDQNDYDDLDAPVSDEEIHTNKCSQKEFTSNVAFQSTTKNLGKNITITSNKTNKNQSTYQEHEASDDYNNHIDEASDSDSGQGNVQITELDEDFSDSEFNTENFDISSTANEPIIESPDDSCSNDKQFDEADIDSKTIVDTDPKCQPNSDKNSMYLNNLNLNKNLTIKSVSKNAPGNSQNNLKQSLDIEEQLLQKTNINTFKKEMNETKDFSSKNLTFRKNVNKSVGQQAKIVNQNICKDNDINSVNKEVKVETFQTQTVIQEITTTVTKTIKTVNQTINQSVKKDVRNSSQSKPMVPLKVQGMMPGQSKNLQGVVVKNASNVPLRVGNTNLVRPMAPVVRPPKVLNPPKPSSNVARMSNPRMQVAKKVPQQNNPNIGKTLKISPTAMVSLQNKRPNTETMSGPFSCFKKPKESLIPGSDFPSFGENSGDFGSQMVSASHTATSNFTSTMKVAKGNSVMTATHTKSEVSSSSKQINKVCTAAAGPRTKASQSTQHQVQENSESSAMKRTTLEAIQKLQKQGLLIKKPRIENEDSIGSGGNNL